MEARSATAPAPLTRSPCGSPATRPRGPPADRSQRGQISMRTKVRTAPIRLSDPRRGRRRDRAARQLRRISGHEAIPFAGPWGPSRRRNVTQTPRAVSRPGLHLALSDAALFFDVKLGKFAVFCESCPCKAGETRRTAPTFRRCLAAIRLCPPIVPQIVRVEGVGNLRHESGSRFSLLNQAESVTQTYLPSFVRSPS